MWWPIKAISLISLFMLTIHLSCISSSGSCSLILVVITVPVTEVLLVAYPVVSISSQV